MRSIWYIFPKTYHVLYQNYIIAMGTNLSLIARAFEIDRLGGEGDVRPGIPFTKRENGIKKGLLHFQPLLKRVCTGSCVSRQGVKHVLRYSSALHAPIHGLLDDA